MRPWDEDELAWARECVAAGDTVEDIAEMAGRSPAEVRDALGADDNLTPHQRRAAAMYVAGMTMRDIGRALKPEAKWPQATAWSAIQSIRRRGHVMPPRRVGRSPDQEARRHG